MSKSPSKSTQHIWPVFLAAFILGAIGFGLAFTSTALPLPTREVTPLTFNPGSFSPFKDPIQLSFVHQEQKVKAYLKQEIIQGKERNQSSYSFTIVDKKISEKVFHRTFENAAVDIQSGSQTLSPDLSFDVARLIQTAKYEITFDEKGTQSWKLISSDPGNLSQVLGFIIESIQYSYPLFSDTSLALEEKWTTEKKSEGNQITTTRWFAGKNDKSILLKTLIDQKFNSESQKGELRFKQKLSISGKGESVIGERGNLKQAQFTLQLLQNLKSSEDKEGQDFVSSVHIVLVAQ